MPVSEHVFDIALKVKVSGMEPTKDDLLKELWGEDAIFVKMVSPPCQESIGVNRLIIKWTKTSHQRRFFDRTLVNGVLILILALSQPIYGDTITQAPQASSSNGDFRVESYLKRQESAYVA